MKNRNFIMGAAALTLATGSAFASLLAPAPTYVRQVAGSPTPCTFVGNKCEITGQNVCTISIRDVSEGAFVTRQAYQSGCLTPLTNNQTPPIIVTDVTIP